MRRRSEKYVVEGSKYAHWIGLYLSFHLNWVLGPFVHGRLQNLQTSEVTFAHVITPLKRLFHGQKFLHLFLDSEACLEQMGPIPSSNESLDIALSNAHT